MGSLLDCKIDQNFKQLEINREIRQENTKKVEKIMEKDNKIKLNKPKVNIKKDKIENKNINNFDDFIDDEIIINTDEEQSGQKKKTKDLNINNNKKKINNTNNTIFINNSNVTISNRNNKKKEEDKLKEAGNSDIKNEFNCFNSNEDNIELDELLNKVFSNNIKTSLNNSNNKNILTESIDKEYFDQLYSEQSQYNINTNQNLTENDEKIINKLKEIKDKINNKNKPKKKEIKYYTNQFQAIKIKHMSKSMNNKQIRKNIPAYRRHLKPSNYNLIFNSYSYDKNFGKLKKFNSNTYGNGSLENSFNKSISSSLLCRSVKDKFYNIYNKSYRSNRSNKNIIKKNSYVKRSRDTSNKYSKHQSYLNNSSLFNLSSNGAFNSQNIKLENKEKRLYNIVSKNAIKINKKQNNNTNNKSSEIRNKIIDTEKENIPKNENQIFYHQYRDIIEIDLPIKYNNESFINNKLSKSNVNNKIILNYNKLNNFNTSIILYDGILYKVIDKKNIGFKISKRYFQITKNCFRYYNDIDNAKTDIEKALVQFDIRHIKDIQIVNPDFLKDIKIDGKDIEFVFCIYLYQNDDFFVFAINNENYGKCVFNIIKLLINYYEDKK